MKKVFEHSSIGTLKLKNRIIRSATHEGMAHADGSPTDDLLKLYLRLAEGGAGAIITGYAGVLQSGKTFSNMRMFDRDAYVDVYRALTDRLRPYGVPLILQLAHGGSRTSSRLTGHKVVTSSCRARNEFGDVCKDASEADIQELIRAFVRAIENARKAGFDGVQLHAAHGYLLSEFISPTLNKRKDQWGGALENRLRIIREILSRAREVVGPYPILVKFSAHDEFSRGLHGDEAVAIARHLQEYSCDAVEVSCGSGNVFHTVRMRDMPRDAILKLAPRFRDLSLPRKWLFRAGSFFSRTAYRPLHQYNVDLAAEIKKHVDIPVIVVGGIRSLAGINDIISRHGIDYVSLCRPFIIEPDIVEKFRAGTQDSSRCIDCGYCLIGVTDNPLRCYYGKVVRKKP